MDVIQSGNALERKLKSFHVPLQCWDQREFFITEFMQLFFKYKTMFVNFDSVTLINFDIHEIPKNVHFLHKLSAIWKKVISSLSFLKYFLELIKSSLGCKFQHYFFFLKDLHFIFHMIFKVLHSLSYLLIFSLFFDSVLFNINFWFLYEKKVRRLSTFKLIFLRYLISIFLLIYFSASHKKKIF